jgi:hypothetical protein
LEFEKLAYAKEGLMKSKNIEASVNVWLIDPLMLLFFNECFNLFVL